MTLFYRTTSPRRMENAEKIQFMLTALGLFIGGFDGLSNPNRLYAFISLLLILIGILYLVLTAYYHKFKLKFKNHSDKFISIIAGVFMFLTGISFALNNIHSRIQYCYYLIGLAYIFGLPRLMKRNKLKYQMTVNASGITMGRMLRKSRFFTWEQLESIKLTPSMIELHLKNSKPKQLFLTNPDAFTLVALEKRLKEIAGSKKFQLTKSDV